MNVAPTRSAPAQVAPAEFLITSVPVVVEYCTLPFGHLTGLPALPGSMRMCSGLQVPMPAESSPLIGKEFTIGELPEHGAGQVPSTFAFTAPFAVLLNLSWCETLARSLSLPHTGFLFVQLQRQTRIAAAATSNTITTVASLFIV